MITEPEERLLTLFEPIVADFGLELYDVEMTTQRGMPTLCVTIDRGGPSVPGSGVTLDELIEVNRELSAVLDIEDPIDGEYNLEVQSPGVERKLTRMRHFEHSVGDTIHVVFNRVIERDTAIDGVLIAVAEDSIQVRHKGEVEVVVPFDAIKSARTTWDWTPKKPGKNKRSSK